MKTSEILDKVTLEFAGGGKLALSDYAPYISNGQEEVEGLSEESEEIGLVKIYSKIVDKLTVTPDLYLDSAINDPSDDDYLTNDDIIELIDNDFNSYSGNGSFICLYEREKCENYLIEYENNGDKYYYFSDNSNYTAVAITFDIFNCQLHIIHSHIGYNEYIINGKEYISVFEYSL